METTSLCILPRLRACSNDRSLLNCKGKYTKSELDSGVYTGFSVTPLQLAPKFMNCSRRFIMAAGKHTGWPYYLMALNINLLLLTLLLKVFWVLIYTVLWIFGFFASRVFIFNLIGDPGHCFLYPVFAESMVQKQKTGIFERGLHTDSVTAMDTVWQPFSCA